MKNVNVLKYGYYVGGHTRVSAQHFTCLGAGFH